MCRLAGEDLEGSHIYAESANILLGNVESCTDDSEITFFKPAVNAIQDLVVASFPEERVLPANLGSEVDL